MPQFMAAWLSLPKHTSTHSLPPIPRAATFNVTTLDDSCDQSTDVRYQCYVLRWFKFSTTDLWHYLQPHQCLLFSFFIDMSGRSRTCNHWFCSRCASSSPVSFMLYIINILCTNVFCLLRKSNRGKVSLGICNASARGAGEKARKISYLSIFGKAGNLAKKKSILHRRITINTDLSRTTSHFSPSYRAWQGWETMVRGIKRLEDEPGTWGDSAVGLKIYATTRVP